MADFHPILINMGVVKTCIFCDKEIKPPEKVPNMNAKMEADGLVLSSFPETPMHAQCLREGLLSLAACCRQGLSAIVAELKTIDWVAVRAAIAAKEKSDADLARAKTEAPADQGGHRSDGQHSGAGEGKAAAGGPVVSGPGKAVSG